MANIEFFQFNCLDDNFGVLVHSGSTGQTASIDAPDAAAVAAALDEKGWNLTHIFVTHHHADHTQGVAALKEKTNCHVIGPDNPSIANLDQTVGDGDSFQFAGETVNVIATPGHTLDMINFHMPAQKVAFTADTLFALGCGRVFEGTPHQMWDSLEKLSKLPPETTIYCGHEYTLANAKFALTVDGTNAELATRADEIEALRAQNKPTLPTTLALELRTNPFLRPSDPVIRKNLGMEDASDADVFAEIRARKDRG
ncbi:MAG: hydroxyacylglutathione hydrolase [Rhizobiaceae bacterium]